VSQAISGDDAALEAFLRSNELWGGAGSVADQAFVHATPDIRRNGSVAFAKLGEEQIAAGIVNVRTESWTSALQKWVQNDVFETPLTDQQRATLRHNIAALEDFARQMEASSEHEQAASLLGEIAKMKKNL
jgi:mono/diheme cytochrome c family protein